MKVITLTNCKYQLLCLKSVRSFQRFNDLPVEIYFIGSEIENTLLREYDCRYVGTTATDLPDVYKWSRTVLKEKLKLFLRTTGDFLFFENDVFFYKQIDFEIFQDGVSGVREYYDWKSRDILNAGFLFFKNTKADFTEADIDRYIDSHDSFPDEYFISEYYKKINYISNEVCFLNNSSPFVLDPACVHFYGVNKPFVKDVPYNGIQGIHVQRVLGMGL
jgi:hypothetical protein